MHCVHLAERATELVLMCLVVALVVALVGVLILLAQLLEQLSRKTSGINEGEFVPTRTLEIYIEHWKL